MRAFVTGASGLIGSNLVRELIAAGIEVRALTRATSTPAALRGLAAELVTGDVLDAPEKLAGLMKSCDWLFHSAAHFNYRNDDMLEATAITGTRHIVEAAGRAGIRRLIVTSSSAVFGSCSTPVVRSERDLPSTDFAEPAYILSKIRQDELAEDLARERGVEVLFVCPTMTVGPHATTLGPSNGIIVSYLNDPLRLTYPGGCNIASVRDVARGHLLAASLGIPGDHYILGSDNLRWDEIHSMVADLCGVERPRLQINNNLAFSAAAFEEVRARLQRRSPLVTREQARMTGRYYWYSSDRAMRRLGYKPRAARAALAEACGWLAASPHISREIRATMLLGKEVYMARREGEAADEAL